MDDPNTSPQNAAIVVSTDEALAKLNAKLAELKVACEIKIIDQATLTASAATKVDCETYIKAVTTFFDSDMKLASLEQQVKKLKLQRTELLAPVEGWRKLLIDKQRSWMADEKRKADEEARQKQQELQRQQIQKAEQEKREREKEAAEKRKQAVALINKEQRDGKITAREAAKRMKEAGAEEEAAKLQAAADAEAAKNEPPPVVRVVPSIPTGTGIRNQTYFKAELTDGGNAILDELLRSKDPERKNFLRRFVEVNESEVSKYARDKKNPAQVMKDLPGVKSWSEG